MNFVDKLISRQYYSSELCHHEHSSVESTSHYDSLHAFVARYKGTDLLGDLGFLIHWLLLFFSNRYLVLYRGILLLGILSLGFLLGTHDFRLQQVQLLSDLLFNLVLDFLKLLLLLHSFDLFCEQIFQGICCLSFVNNNLSIDDDVTLNGNNRLLDFLGGWGFNLKLLGVKCLLLVNPRRLIGVYKRHG